MFTKHDHRPEGATNRAATPTRTLPGEKISNSSNNQRQEAIYD